MFIRVVRIFRMIEESICNDCSSNYSLFKSVMKNSAVGLSGEELDRSLSRGMFGGEFLDQENPRLLLKFIMSG